MVQQYWSQGSVFEEKRNKEYNSVECLILFWMWNGDEKNGGTEPKWKHVTSFSDRRFVSNAVGPFDYKIELAISISRMLSVATTSTLCLFLRFYQIHWVLTYFLYLLLNINTNWVDYFTNDGKPLKFIRI